MKIGSGVRVDIGEGAGGGVVAKVPAPGAWVGLLIYPTVLTPIAVDTDATEGEDATARAA